MSDLILNSFTIKNFRIFDEITLPNLGRVNLIVGKNNVGKSTILEAVQIFATENSEYALVNFLTQRKEGVEHVQPQHARGLSKQDIRAAQLTSIPHNRASSESIISFSSGDIDLKIALNSEGKSGVIQARRTIPFQDKMDPYIGSEAREYVASFFIDHYFFKPNNVPQSSELDSLWSEISLTQGEHMVIEALQTIDPTISQINILPKQLINGERVPIVRLSKFDEPVPLASLGSGAVHIFHFILALLAAKDGILLADEIESGLHYSIQYKLWRLIFKFAAELNVQVFSTTHSDDCISAFQMAAEESDEEGVLIRLENRNGKIVPTIANEDLLKSAVEQDIEVR